MFQKKSMAYFLSLKQNFIAYRSSKVFSRKDCIFEIQQLWQSGFSRVYSNSCNSCSFEPERIKIGQSSHKMYSNNILNFQESTLIVNACTKRSGNLLNAPYVCVCFCYIYIYIYICNSFLFFFLQLFMAATVYSLPFPRATELQSDPIEKWLYIRHFDGHYAKVFW